MMTSGRMEGLSEEHCLLSDWIQSSWLRSELLFFLTWYLVNKMEFKLGTRWNSLVSLLCGPHGAGWSMAWRWHRWLLCPDASRQPGWARGWGQPRRGSTGRGPSAGPKGWAGPSGGDMPSEAVWREVGRLRCVWGDWEDPWLGCREDWAHVEEVTEGLKTPGGLGSCQRASGRVEEDPPDVPSIRWGGERWGLSFLVSSLLLCQ